MIAEIVNALIEFVTLFFVVKHMKPCYNQSGDSNESCTPEKAE